jgi:hypothetical protein
MKSCKLLGLNFEIECFFFCDFIFSLENNERFLRFMCLKISSWKIEWVVQLV